MEQCKKSGVLNLFSGYWKITIFIGMSSFGRKNNFWHFAIIHSFWIQSINLRQCCHLLQFKPFTSYVLMAIEMVSCHSICSGWWMTSITHWHPGSQRLSLKCQAPLKMGYRTPLSAILVGRMRFKVLKPLAFRVVYSESHVDSWMSHKGYIL